MPSVRPEEQATAHVYIPVAVKPIQARTVCKEKEKLNNNEINNFTQWQGISLGSNFKNDVIFAMESLLYSMIMTLSIQSM